MNEEMITISKKELEHLNGYKDLYELHVSKLGENRKIVDSQYVEFVTQNIDKMSLLAMFNTCRNQGLDMEYSAFRKFVIEKEVKDFYVKGLTPEEIVEALKERRKHSRMDVSAVVKILEKMGFNPEEKVKEVESLDDIKGLVNRMIKWQKPDTPTLAVLNEIDIYKVMLMSQPDDSVLYISKEVIRQFRFKTLEILDKNIDMTALTGLSTIRIDGCELIVMSSYNEISPLVRIQLIKSSMPQAGKNYAIEYLKQHYRKIHVRSSITSL